MEPTGVNIDFVVPCRDATGGRGAKLITGRFKEVLTTVRSFSPGGAK